MPETTALFLTIGLIIASPRFTRRSAPPFIRTWLLLGADATEEGCVVVDSHQRTSVPGLYAAGDVVLSLDQISNAMGQAGVA